MNEIDAIVPIYFVDFDYFRNNLESWFQELPIRKLFLGINREIKGLDRIVSSYPKIEKVDQLKFKTLGFCLADLMKRVETEWFVYLHADVELTPFCFEIMKRHANENVGIVESNRVLFDGKNKIYPDQHRSLRAYSGFQLIKKKAIEDIINKIDDDFVYRNEDYVFQNACVNAGFEYVKSWSMFIHQTANKEWSMSEKETAETMFKGLIKYTTPNEDITIPACLVSISNYLRQYPMDAYDFMKDFVELHNHEWGRIILNKVMGGTINAEKT